MTTQKAGGIIIQNKRLLVVRNKGEGFFIAPGGTIEAGETPEQAIIRELREELAITVQPSALAYFGAFDNHNKTAYMTLFIVNSWAGLPRAANEIAQIKWIQTAEAGCVLATSIFAQYVIPQLLQSGIIV